MKERYERELESLRSKFNKTEGEVQQQHEAELNKLRQQSQNDLATQKKRSEEHLEQITLVLTLNTPMATKVVCFSRLLKCLRSLYGKSVDPDQTAPIEAVCSGSMLFASIPNLSVMLGNYLQQTTRADDIFRCIFFALKRLTLSCQYICLEIVVCLSSLLHINWSK